MNVINVKTLALYAISLLLLPITTNAQNNVNGKRPDSVIISRLPKLGNASDILRNSRSNIDKEPKFLVTSNGFSITQNNKRNFIVYEFTGLKASDMKSSIISKLTTMFKSPKDAIHTISDNIISVEGYSSNVFRYNGYSCDILFNLTIEFKDGKIRYNYPVIVENVCRFWSYWHVAS